MDMITFDKPQRPYIVLESVTEKHERREELKERNLHVISPEENNPVKLGRGHQCEIRITDISVSRTHSEIKYQNDKFYAVDLKSKFGTLVKFR
jgi:pSer/pThr/pTyr-binding forkhead associated (FHA) protein